LKFDIEKQFNEEEFVVKTCNQISKDLVGLIAELPAWKVDFDENPLNQIAGQLAVILLKMKASELQQFIYSVDLKEKDFLRGVDALDELHLMSILVIKREAQKVFLKSMFS
jgi:hypothetical protein